MTGPRAEQPKGVRVLEPPPGTRQHQRGNLYVIVELFGQSAQHEALANRMASVLQRAYYTAKGSQAEVMATGIDAAHKLLQEHNSTHRDGPIAAGMLCAALLNGRLLIATSGSAFALVRAGEKVHMFPSEVQDNGTVDTIPERIEVFRQDVEPQDVIFLGGGSWLNNVKLRTLAGIVAYTSAETCGAAADELYDLGGSVPLPGLLVVLGSDSAPPSTSGPTSGPDSGTGGAPKDSRGPSAGSGGGKPLRPKRPRLGGLPTALSAVPASSPGYRGPGYIGPRAADAPPGPEPPPGPQRSRGAEATASDLDDAPMSTDDGPAMEPIGRETGVTPSEEAGLVQPGEPSRWRASLASWSRQFSVGAASGWAATRGFFGRMLPDAAGNRELDDGAESLVDDEPDAQTSDLHTPVTGDDWAPLPRSGRPDPKSAAWENVGAPPHAALASLDDPHAQQDAGVETEEDGAQATREVGATAAAAPMGDAAAQTVAPIGAAVEAPRDEAVRQPTASQTAEPMPPMPAIEPFEAPEPARGARARLFILLAVMVVVLAPAVVGGIYLSEAPSRRAEAEELTDGAAALLSSAQTALDLDDRVIARRQLTEAQDFLIKAVEMDDWTDRRRGLAQEIQAELDEVSQVVPLYGLTTPIIQFGDDAEPARIVVVNDEIYILDTGREAVFRYRFDPAGERVLTAEGQVVLRQGDTFGNVVVGALHDIAWLPLTAGREDKPSLLILDRQNNVFRFDQRVEGVTRLVFGGQAEWGSVGQIESYGGRVYVADEATGQIYRYDAGRYDAAGEPWFGPETQTSLAGIRGMEIDGDIWFLYNNGMILRYRDRQQVPFSLESGFGFAEEPGDFYVAREGKALIYVVDRLNDRILVYNKQGEYQYQLVAPEGYELQGVSALAVDEIAGRMFILTRAGLYLHPLVE